MKKIVFVEKQDNSSYDPVSTYVANRKSNSTMKVPSSAAKKTQVEKKIMDAKLESKKNMNMREKEKYGQKIGRKGDQMPPKSFEYKKKQKQETIYGFAKNELKREEQYEEREERQKITTPIKLQPIQKVQNNNKPTNNSNNNNSKEIEALKKRVKELQKQQSQYNRRLLQYEEKQEKFIKGQQKLAKLQKEYKLSAGETKGMAEKLKGKEEQIKVLMKKDEISYSKKRQVLLMNQMNQLKKVNRELVSRIKNYKGTDLVEVSLNRNKADILKEYENPTSQDINKQNNKIESLAYRLCSQLNKYVKSKKAIQWNDEVKYINTITSICKDISLQCLSQQFQIPQSNEDCVNIYDQIQTYKNALQPILSKEDLNFVITEENIELINHLQQKSGQLVEYKNKSICEWKSSPKKFKKIAEASQYYHNKAIKITSEYEKNYNYQQVIIAHCLAQLSYVKTMLNKQMGSLKEDLSNLLMKLKELQELATIGSSAKESIFVFVQQNLPQLLIKIPNLNLKIKEMGSIFRKNK